MIEVRWHGRAGQGAKTSSQLLAMASLRSGHWVQAFPEYGPERGGAPMRTFTRIDDHPIRRRYGVTAPDVVVVIEPSVMSEVDVREGLAADGCLIINSSEPIEGAVTVDAAAIAKPRYVNVVMLGALAGALGEPAVEDLLASAHQLFSRKLTPSAQDELRAAIEYGAIAARAAEVAA